jgi:pullulanase
MGENDPRSWLISNLGFASARAYWIDRQTIALPAGDLQMHWTCQLLHSADPAADISSIELAAAAGLTAGQLQRFPQLGNYSVFHLPPNVGTETLKAILKGPLALGVFDMATLKYITGIQTAGVLDDLFYFGGKLGAQFTNGPYDNISVGVWAPTAQSLKLLLFQAPDDTTPANVVPMLEANGVWSAEIESSWRDRYYLFGVQVWVPGLHRVVENIVTDPYSADLALNGGKSRLTDLNSPRTKPDGWDRHASPPVRSTHELSIWEVHIRDFSAQDASIPEEQRGTYLAFANPDASAIKHLRRLADAGLKAVHLLPFFHIASINEDKNLWQSPGDLSSHPPDSGAQQAAVEKVKNFDAFNWGYDPVHYMAPEGSYAVNPNERVKECRAMLQGIHSAGLRVIQDLVFNHTSAHGQNSDSVLDKIVPGYYYRRDGDGNVLDNSCCSDTASEHRMMEKLMIDCIVQNARQYKIDGFRFDLMSFHFVYNLRRIQQALSKLTLEEDGVDGSKIYLYGEGWTTGATANNALGPNGSQANLYGTGIGTFNDRIRDAVRGGNPYWDPRVQGFATGLYTASSPFTWQSQSQQDQLNQLLTQSDWIRAGLAGNMRDFSFLDSRGEVTAAGALDYEGQKVGYTASPLESINFCSVHDNQTLFDAIQLKAPLTDNTATRARRQVLALSLIALGQGIPFFHAGDELLRSKDMDNNSYNSGDWFHKLDFTYQSNNWGGGLPLASENGHNWPIMQPLLANPALKPTSEDILYTRDAFEALLRIRASSELFYMPTLAEVQRNLSFLKTGPGVIAMRIRANCGTYTGYQEILVIFNSTVSSVSVQNDSLKGLRLALHPALNQAGDFNAKTGTATVPALTPAVFV